MKLFNCQNCNNTVHFDSLACVNCGFRLGYLPDMFTISALSSKEAEWTAAANPSGSYLFCDNAQFDVCNWMVPAGSGRTMCIACRFNHVVPNLAIPENVHRWRKLEVAKHYLFYALTRWRLPTRDRTEDPEHGLMFDFRADTVEPAGNVLTGHEDGLITINLAEADDGIREQRRSAMGEPYRTLVGHFRHEIGHYYWDLLVRGSAFLPRVRAVFGDDREDYAGALKRHYENGPPADWQNAFISAYATTHAWEDFAETWAHYMHMVDALDTARSFGMSVQPRQGLPDDLAASIEFDPYAAQCAETLVNAWIPLTIAINSVNRSMGQPDLYPFVLSTPVMDKLQLIHDIIHSSNGVSVHGGKPIAAQTPAAWSSSSI
jgi:hypothetical protein